MKSTSQKVNDFLEDIQATLPDRFEIIKEIRAIFHQENNKFSEDIKYGGLVFNLSNQLVAGIFATKIISQLNSVMALSSLILLFC